MTRKNVNDLTSNQFWGGINRRAQKRAALLTRAGFKYVDGFWIPKRSCFSLKPSKLSNSVLGIAPNRAFFEMIRWAR